MVLLMVSPAFATPFTGNPWPSLSPVFGTLINFDDKATGTVVGATDYVAQGVASITETEGLGTFARYAGSQSMPNYIGTGASGERKTDAALGWDGTILIQFAGLASKVGIGIADSQGGPETIYAYDSLNNLLESFQAPTGSNVYVGFDRAVADIKYFKITGDFFAVDDLQFIARTAVPEPATMFLLGFGLAGIAAISRKRIKN
jgi:hypothetical protein